MVVRSSHGLPDGDGLFMQVGLLGIKLALGESRTLMGSVIYLKENPGEFSLFLLLLILLLMWLMVISLQLCEATRIATWRRSKRTDSRRTGAAVIPFGGSLSSFNCRMVNLLWPTFRSPNRIWAEQWPPPCFESGRLHLIYTDPSPFPLFFI